MLQQLLDQREFKIGSSEGYVKELARRPPQFKTPIVDSRVALSFRLKYVLENKLM
jgi:hypothetical protein